MGVFKSPGVYIKETDWGTFYPKFKKNYLRKSKIANIFDLDVKSAIMSKSSK
jgi:hypothetical protein